MNISGIVRRMDELGRIVIPIEIRKVLNINIGEPLEFSIIENNIIIKKREIDNSNYNLIGDISKVLNSSIDGDYFITDREKIIASSNSSFMNKPIDSKILSCINIYDNKILYENDMGIKENLYLYPYLIDNTISGFLILYNINEPDKYNKLAKFICNYIHDKNSLS